MAKTDSWVQLGTEQLRHRLAREVLGRVFGHWLLSLVQNPHNLVKLN
jgi:hypothetical protein